jgi:hypothetical protein
LIQFYFGKEKIYGEFRDNYFGKVENLIWEIWKQVNLGKYKILEQFS